MKYNRSAKGASEDLTLKNVKIEVTYNGTPLADYTKDISFPLDEYGDAFDGAPKDGGKITDLDFAKEYKAKIDIFGGKTLKSGDTVKVKVSAKVDSAFKTLAESIVLAVIDTSESANYYNELSDTEYVSAFKTAAPDGGITPIVYDFTTVTGDPATELGVNWCSAAASQFTTEKGLKLDVNNSYDGAFKMSLNAIDLSNRNCVIEYCVESGFQHSGEENFVVWLVSKEQSSGSYKAYELSQGEFATNPSETFKTDTISNFYKNDWDVVSEATGNSLTDAEKASYNGCDKTKVSVIKISTKDAVGTVYIKSIKFIAAN